MLPRTEEEQGQIDLEAAIKVMPPILVFSLTPLQAAAVIAQLQLALRHPNNRGSVAQVGMDFAEKLISAFPPAAREALELGFDRAFDVPTRLPVGEGSFF